MEQARDRLADAQAILETAPPTAEEAAEYVDGTVKFIAEIDRILTGDGPGRDDSEQTA